MRVTRRDFLKAMAGSAAGAAVLSGCGPGLPQHLAPGVPDNEFLLESPVTLPGHSPLTIDAWYATACSQCTAGCAIQVRVVDGQAKKAEGIAAYPVNQGKLCSLGQTVVQTMYHPDRLQVPMRRSGNRFTGPLDKVSWEDALNEFYSRLKERAAANDAASVVFAVGPLSGQLAMLVDKFMSSFGGQAIGLDTMDDPVLREAVKRVFGQDQIPEFDIRNANYILNFGTDFLGSWLSPVHYSRAYGEFRQGAGRQQRGYLVQVEPRLSMTAANADEWVPIKPGNEGTLALGIASSLVSQGLVSAQAAASALGPGGQAALQAFSPDQVATITGVSTDKIASLAKDFASRQPALALGGQIASGNTTGLFNVTSVMLLNQLVGNAGKAGGVLFNAPPPVYGRFPASPFARWQELTSRMASGNPTPVNLLLVYDANPAYELPSAVGFADAVKKVPYIVSFSNLMDETTSLADLILPTNAGLEDWGNLVSDPAPGMPAVAFQQPVTSRIWATESLGDLLLMAADQLGGGVRKALPWSTMQEVVRDAATQLQGVQGGSIQETDPEAFWLNLLKNGGWWGQAPTAGQSGSAAQGQVTLPQQPASPTFDGAAADFPFNLIAYPTINLRDGRPAYLPWLQGQPDPMTTITWQSWVEMHPDDANAAGLVEGDIVTVEAPHGSIDVPVYVYPGIGRGLVAIPMGQGHTQYGQYAQGRGANVLSILSPLTDQDTGALAWGATRVRLTKTGRQIKIPKFEGSVSPVQLEDFPVVEVTNS